MYRIKMGPPLCREIIAELSSIDYQSPKFDQGNTDHPEARLRADSYQTSVQLSTKAAVGPSNRRQGRSRNYSLFAFFLIFLSTFAVSGCGGIVFRNGSSGPTSAGSASLVATPTTVDFGTVTVGNSANQKLSISNTGSAAVQISQLTLSNGAFTIDGQGTLPVSVAAGSSLNFNVHFSPADSTDVTGQLSVMTSTSLTATATVKLQGKGSTQTAILSGLSCASTNITGASTDTCTVTTNIAAPANGVVVNLSSSTAAVAVPASVTVPAGASSTTFSASVSAVSTNQTATIGAKQGGVSKSVSISLIAPTSSTVASTISALSCAATSFSGASTTSCTVSLSSPAPSSGMTVGVASSSSPVTVPASVTVGSGATTAAFTATVASVSTTQTVTLTASANGSSKSFALQLNAATAPVAPTVSALSCGSTSITGSLADSCIVTLSGSAPTGGVAVGLASSSSSITVPASVTVPATATSATFTANVSSVSSAQTVTLTATTGSASRSVSLQLNVATPVLTVNATTISFGSVALNTPAAQTVTLTASGAAVTVSAVAVTGSGFSLSPVSVPLTISAGQTATITVTFDPTTAGSFTGQLTIASNSSTNATIAVSLSGTGGTPKVDLSWVAPASSTDPIAGYNVYRAASGSGAFALLGSAGLQTTYIDPAVQSGQSYDYEVKSVDSAGVESSPSNVTTVSIP